MSDENIKYLHTLAQEIKVPELGLDMPKGFALHVTETEDKLDQYNIQIVERFLIIPPNRVNLEKIVEAE